jgi:ferredoxin
MGMKIVVDTNLCEANALCMKLAPEVFAVDDDDTLNVLQERPAEALRDKVKQAAARCPRGAIAVIDE